MSSYSDMKERHEQEINAFPMVFAFSVKQFEEGMAKLGLTPEDTDKVYKFGGTGGFYRRSDSPALKELFDRHEKETQDALDGDSTGDGFIFEMFDYELSNHEYVVSGDASYTLDMIGLSWEEVAASKKLMRGLKKAIAVQDSRRQDYA
ncbi:MAG: hypothetical protein LBL73_05355 [Synergistaceae bacterium]|jgi:hypothetical protein|nr:hypothetical protein [Synergistaceae bacterium]